MWRFRIMLFKWVQRRKLFCSSSLLTYHKSSFCNRHFLLFKVIICCCLYLNTKMHRMMGVLTNLVYGSCRAEIIVHVVPVGFQYLHTGALAKPGKESSSIDDVKVLGLSLFLSLVCLHTYLNYGCGPLLHAIGYSSKKGALLETHT